MMTGLLPLQSRTVEATPLSRHLVDENAADLRGRTLDRSSWLFGAGLPEKLADVAAKGDAVARASPSAVSLRACATRWRPPSSGRLGDLLRRLDDQRERARPKRPRQRETA